MNPTPPLYDAHGNLIKRDPTQALTETEGDSKTAATPPDKSAQPTKLPESEPRKHLPAWLTGWRLFLEVCTLLGAVLAVYALRPILSVTSHIGTGVDGVYGVKATITDTGTSISDVFVQCIPNKILFEDKFTLEFQRFLKVEEYAVGDVKTGESFTVNCTFGWSLWEKHGEEGMVIAGYGTPGYTNVGVAFRYVNGTPVVTSPVPAMLTVGFSDAIRYQIHRLTAVDGSFVVKYRWIGSPFQQTTVIHMIESAGPEPEIKWRVAPAREPVIADAPAQAEGWKMTARSNSADFGMVMQGGTYRDPK